MELILTTLFCSFSIKMCHIFLISSYVFVKILTDKVTCKYSCQINVFSVSLWTECVMREKLKYTRNIITQAYVLSYCTADKIYSFFLFGWTNPLKNDRSPFALPVNTNVDLLLTDYIKRNVKQSISSHVAILKKKPKQVHRNTRSAGVTPWGVCNAELLCP